MIHFHNLQNEMQAHIFFLGHRDYALHDSSAVAFLTTITSTCKYWRDFGLSLSCLWTSIVYDGWTHAPNTNRMDVTLAKTEAFLKRSRNASIDLHLVHIRYENIEPLIRLVLPHLQRCRTIRIQSLTGRIERHEGVLHGLLPLPGPMLRLKELQISFLPYCISQRLGPVPGRHRRCGQPISAHCSSSLWQGIQYHQHRVDYDLRPRYWERLFTQSSDCLAAPFPSVRSP